MSINLDKIKERLNKFQTNNSKSDVKIGDYLWKVPMGKSQIRIVPYKYNSESPFMELYFYYDLNKMHYLSPKSYGEEDPIADFMSKLRVSGERIDKALYKKLMPSLRIFVPVVVRGEEDKGVKFWSFGKNTYIDIMNIISDPDYGDITDIENGRDLIVDRTSTTNSRLNDKTTIRPKPNKSVLSKDKLEIFLSEQKNIFEIFKKWSYEELQLALEKYIEYQENNSLENVESVSSNKLGINEKVDKVNKKFEDVF